MEIILPLLACLLLGAPIGLAGSVLIGRGPQFMSGFFGGHRGLGWPRGVQEEDPPGGWMWHLPGDAAGDGPATKKPPGEPEVSDDPSPTGAVPLLRPITARIGPGTNRRRSRW